MAFVKIESFFEENIVADHVAHLELQRQGLRKCLATSFDDDGVYYCDHHEFWHHEDCYDGAEYVRQLRGLTRKIYNEKTVMRKCFAIVMFYFKQKLEFNTILNILENHIYLNRNSYHSFKILTALEDKVRKYYEHQRIQALRNMLRRKEEELLRKQIFSYKYSDLLVEETEVKEYDNLPSCSFKNTGIKTKSKDLNMHDDHICHIYNETTEGSKPPRSIMLLKKIVYKIKEFKLARNCRLGFNYCKQLCKNIPKLVSDDVEDGMIELVEYNDTRECFDVDDLVMCKLKKVPIGIEQAGDESAHSTGEGELNVEQQQNVILTTHSEQEVAQPISLDQGVWEKLCSPQNVTEYTQLMSRWQRYKTVTWKTSDSWNTNLFKANLPIDFIRSNLESPNCIMFSQYAFFRSDMEVKIVVNANKFYVGSLQASFYYGASTDSNYADRENTFSASQLTHVLVDAASSNDAIIKIPYRHYKPLMATSARDDDKNILDMGLFRLLILNQLRAPAGAALDVSVSVFFRFVNPKFHGMIPRELSQVPQVENQMMGAVSLVKTAASLVNQVFPDPQRDNPTDIVPPKPLVPWSAHSWSIGDLLPEATNVLRLQATGNTPHPPGTLCDDPEMDIRFVCRKYGLIRKIFWKKDFAVGKILQRIPFSPVLDEYYQVNVKHDVAVNANVMPPVSVISSLFAFWRGSLEYKLDFISTQFHTGRLIIAYMPRLVLQRDPTIEQLTYCDHIIVDLREEKEVIYVNSFLSDKPWYPRRGTSSNSSELYPPGYIYIAVLNQLSCANAVSDEIEINCYMRGGEDFEVHVPVSPNIALSFNTNLPVPQVPQYSYLETYGPPYTSMYAGIWHTTGGGCVLRYGTTSDHVTQFSPTYLDKARVVQLYYPSNARIPHPTDNSKSLNFLVFFATESTKTYCYGALFETKALATSFASKLKNCVVTSEALAAMTQISKEGDWLPQSFRYYWRAVDSLTDSFVFCEAGDERDSNTGPVINVERTVLSTQGGNLTFGENVQSLKQLCRRYHLYAEKTVKKVQNDNMVADWCVPIMPQGLPLDISSDYFKYAREGVIPLIASAYRFYRGSVRFRLVVTCRDSLVIWVQHKPEYDYKFKTDIPTTTKAQSGWLQSGYAYMFQCSKVNEIVEFEVPFYLPGQFGLLQSPNEKDIEDAVHYIMGFIFIGVNSTNQENDGNPVVKMQLYYSIGDDMSFSVFQGYPPMLDVSPYINHVTEQGPLSWFQNKTNALAASITKEAIKTVKKEIMSPIESDDEGEGVEEKTVNFEEVVNKLLPEVDTAKKLMLVNVFTNLVHIAVNPDLKTVAWSIASCLVNLGFLAYDYIQSLCSTLLGLLKKIFGQSGANKSKVAPASVASIAEAQAGPEVDPSIGCEAAFVSTLVAGMLAVMSAKSKPLPKSMPSFTKYLYDGVPKFTLTANGLFTFFRNNLLMIKKIWYWLVAKFNIDFGLHAEMNDKPAFMMRFIKQIQWCLDKKNEDELMHTHAGMLTVYKLANIAQYFLAKKAVSTYDKSLPIFENFCKMIIKKRDEMSEKFMSPAVKFEPFVISICGDSNIGKSHLAQFLSKELLRSIDFKTYGELTYVRNPANAYWNGLKNQPVCIYDDFLNIVDPQYGLLEIGELYQLKSKAVFNPPMAAVEEKKRRYGPLIVILLKNVAFQDIQGIACPEAWMRRQDVMYQARKKECYKGIHPRDIDKGVASKFGHLEFAQYDNPAAKDAKHQQHGAFIPYDEFLPRLIQNFHDYYNRECELYHEALTNMKEFAPHADLTLDEYNDAIDRFFESLQASEELLQEHDCDALTSDMHCITTALKEYRTTDNMSTFVMKSLKKRKQIELEKEKENKISVSVNTKQVPVVKETPLRIEVQAEDEVFDYRYTADKFIERVMGLFTSLLNKDVKYFTIDNNKDIKQFVEEVLKSGLNRFKVESHIRTIYRHFNIALRCRCLCDFFMMNVKRYSPYKGPNDAGYFECSASYFMASSFNNGYDSVYLCQNGCGFEKCLFKRTADVEWLTEYIRGSLGITFSMLPEDRYPNFMRDYKEQIEGIGTMPLMSPAEVTAKVEEEVKDKSWLCKLADKLPKWSTVISWCVKVLAVITAVLGFIKLGTMCMTSVYGIDTEKKECVLANNIATHNIEIEEMWYEGVKKKLHNADEEGSSHYSVGTVGKKPNPNVPVKAIAKAQCAPELENVILNKIKRNTFWLVVTSGPDDSRKIRNFRCLGLVDHSFLILDHYVYYIKSVINPSVMFMRGGIYIPVPLEIFDNLEKCDNSTIMIGEIHKTVPAFCNIVKFFCPSELTRNLSPQAQLFEYMVAYKDNPDDCEYVMKIRNFDRIERENRVLVNNDDGSTTLVNCVYKYPYGGRGVCGSVLVTSSNVNQPIIGIHVAGLSDGSVGYAEAIVYETFAPLIQRTKLKLIENSVEEYELIQDAKPLLPLDGNIDILGYVRSRRVVRMPEKSRLCLTECANEITNVTYDKPVMSPKDERIADDPFSPLLEGCKNHTMPLTPIEENYVALAIEDVRNMILATVKPRRLQVGRLSVEEAVCGVHGLPEYEALPLDTSEGFPWIHLRPKGAKDKRWMFEIEEDKYGYRRLMAYDERLRRCLEEREKARKEGYYYESVFVDCLKDAKIPKEKVLEKGKTRIFSISPVDFTIQQRQYTFDFSVAYTSARIKAEHGVGIDIYGLETDVLVNHMLSKGNNMICGDYSKFGDRLYTPIVLAVFDIIAEWYEINGCVGEEYTNVIRAFGRETAYSVHLIGNMVYQMLCGMPSGNPLTVVINSIVNCVYVRIAWLKIMERFKVELRSLSSFHEHAVVVTYGDDLWIGVSDEVRDLYNAVTMKEVFAEYGLKFTNATKGEEMVPYCLLEDANCTFLKCTFARHEKRNVWVARLERRAVEEVCNWTWNTGRDLRESSIEACKAMLELCYGHGSVYYTKMRNKIIKFWQKRNVYIVLPDWQSVDLRIYNI